ncbi:hypothetical protein Tco_0946582 [Tanacetum coccineum]
MVRRADISLVLFKEVHSENVEDEDVESDDDLDDDQDGTEVHNFEMEDSQIREPSFYKSFIDEVNRADTTTPQNQSGIPKKIHKPTKSNIKPKIINMKRRGRQSGGSVRLAEHIAQSKATQQHVIQYLESETYNNNQNNKFSIEAVASVINHLVEGNLIVKGSTLWLFAMDLFEDPVKREMFMIAEYYYKHMYKEPCMTSQQKGEDWMKDDLNGVFVYTLALGVSNRDVAERFQRSGETISRAFHDVLEAITARGNGFHGLASDIIRPKDPSFPIPPQIMNDKRYMLYFKDCIGCIDGTHIGACIPEAQQVRYIGKYYLVDKGYPERKIGISCSVFQDKISSVSVSK